MRYTDSIADSDGDGDDEQRADATIVATESR
jgi:hypothetical protein